MSPDPLGSKEFYAPAPPGGSGDACGDGLACALGQVAEPVVLALWFSAFTVVALAALGYFSRGREECAAERDRLVAERNAFEDFVDRVTDLEPWPVRMTDGAGRDAPMPADPGPADDLAAVREAYRETVMDVDHYGAEYDEPLAQHMAAELGADVATAVTGDGRLTAGLQRAVVSSASEAFKRRVAVGDTLEAELSALEDLESDLEAVLEGLADRDDVPLTERSASELLALHEELEDLLAECRELLERRQAQLPERAIGGRSTDVEEFSDYLYGGLDVSFPALTGVLEAIETLRAARRRVRIAFTACA